MKQKPRLLLLAYCDMIEISSENNKAVKSAAKLLLKKYRDSESMFIAEGLRLVRDICEYDRSLVDKIFVAASAPDKTLGDVVLPDSVFGKLCETDSSQGIVATVKKPTVVPKGSYSLFLDRVRDPGNVGTLIRTAAAAGYDDVYLYDCADAYSGKVVRSTMSAVVKVNIFDKADISTATALKHGGYKLICADMDGEDSYGYKAENDKVCLIIGNEANGVCPELEAVCDMKISLPMSGRIESLNAAVCGGILMYNIKYLK